MSGFTYVALTVALTVYGQLVTKWQLGSLELPSGSIAKLRFLLRQCIQPWVLSAFLAAFLASLSWMAAMTTLPISVAYPFTSIAFVLVVLGSSIFFDEPLTKRKIAGTLLLTFSLFLISQ
ncbi:MAG: EamA family transporter [Rubripirellula sp.]|nr:EamA family transporter [Rubripirellula sp.]